jgi:anaerobic selenocysteine-containing dehydrogenase
VCALDVEVISERRIGRIHGARDQTYTSGVICAKVARYSERIHHPDRLTQPLRRIGPKGSGQFTSISWDEALDRIAENFLSVERELGPEGVWPYFGTMGLVMRDGIERLTHTKRYSRFHGTICVGIAWPGYVAGTGRLIGADPRDNGEVGLHRHLGHQRGLRSSQRDGSRGSCAEGTWRQDSRDRHL